MLQTSIVNKSELYYIFSDGLKKPSKDWIIWYNRNGKVTIETLLQAVDCFIGKEISQWIPKTLDYKELSQMYLQLFQTPGPKRVVPVESIYKNWTNRKKNYPFISNNGYLMGESALQMNKIYKKLGFHIPEKFKLTPDHIILQLELLGHLEETGNANYIYEFIFDHLDWTYDLVADCEQKGWSGFYYEWIKMIHLFFENRCWE